MHAIVVRLVWFVALLVGLTVFGVLGYRWIEGWGWLDAVYMTVIALSTVGFQEAQPMSQAGRAFSIVLIAAGVGSALYLITMIAQLILDGQLTRIYLRERMAMRIRRKDGHVIVAGYGRYGRAVVDELLGADQQVAVIDSDPALVDEFETRNLAYVLGSAADDETLEEAGIRGAAAIVAATPSDADNVFITLASKDLNPAIRIYARSESPAATRRLQHAGADQVVSPFQMGGSLTAASIMRPSVVDFLQVLSPRGAPEVDIEQVLVAEGSRLGSRAIEEVEHDLGALRIVAIRPGEGSIQIAPPSDRRIDDGDMLIVVGERAPLIELAELAETAQA